MTIRYKYHLILLLTLLLGYGSYSAIKGQPLPTTLKFGFYNSKIMGHGNPVRDESLKRWIDGLRRNVRSEWLAKTKFTSIIYELPQKLNEDLQTSAVDLINLSVLDYFRLGLNKLVIPLLTGSNIIDTKFEKYLLIANIKNSTADISEIKNAEVTLPDSKSSALMKVWLSVELRNRINRNNERSIVIAEADKNEADLLLSVFFNTLKYVIVREGIYLVACELNPQINKQVKILAESPKLINYFLGYRYNLNPEVSSALTEEALNFHKTIDGRQLLNIAQVEAVHKLSVSEMKETESLIRRFNLISK